MVGARLLDRVGACLLVLIEIRYFKFICLEVHIRLVVTAN